MRKLPVPVASACLPVSRLPSLHVERWVGKPGRRRRRLSPIMRVGLSGRAGRPPTRTLVSRAVHVDRNVQGGRQTLSVLVSKNRLAALDCSNRGGGDLGFSTELGLGQTPQNAQIAWKSLMFGDMDQVTDRHTQRVSGACKQVDLRGRVSSLPVVECASPNVRKSREVREREVAVCSKLAQPIGGEAPHNTTAHREIPRALISRHFAGPLGRSSQAVSIDRVIVQTP